MPNGEGNEDPYKAFREKFNVRTGEGSETEARKAYDEAVARNKVRNAARKKARQAAKNEPMNG